MHPRNTRERIRENDTNPNTLENGSGKMIRIQKEPDPQHWYSLTYISREAEWRVCGPQDPQLRVRPGDIRLLAVHIYLQEI
jgi:hypothetical protein